MRSNEQPIPTLPAPRPSRRPREDTGAQRREAERAQRKPASGKARELDKLLWIDFLVIAALVLLLALAKASL